MSDGLTIEPQFDERRPVLHSGADACRRIGIAGYCARVKVLLSPTRFAHVERVTELTEAIGRASGFSWDELRAACLAAVLHDVARELPSERLFALAPPEHEMEREYPLAVHGRAGRAIAASWGVDDERVLAAIEGHVFGVPFDDRIGMAVYVADVSEPGRGVNGDIRALAVHDLAGAYRRAVETKVQYLRRRGKDVHPRTLQVHDALARAS